MSVYLLQKKKLRRKNLEFARFLVGSGVGFGKCEWPLHMDLAHKLESHTENSEKNVTKSKHTHNRYEYTPCCLFVK